MLVVGPHYQGCGDRVNSCVLYMMMYSFMELPSFKFWLRDINSCCIKDALLRCCTAGAGPPKDS